MNKDNFYNSSQAQAVIFSEVNIFALHLIQSLSKKGCQVRIISSSTTTWKALNPSLLNDKNLFLTSIDDTVDYKVNYLFFLSSVNPKEKEDTKQLNKKIDLANFILKRDNPKSALVLPYVNESEDQLKKKEKIKKDLSLIQSCIYIGEPISDFVENDSRISNIVLKLVKDNKLFVPNLDSELYLVDPHDASELMLKHVLAFGFGKKEVALADKTTIKTFTDNLLKLEPTATIDYQDIPEKAKENIVPLEVSHFIESKIKKYFETARYKYPKIVLNETIKKTAVPPKKISTKKERKKKLITYSVLVVLWLLILPFILLLISSVSLFVSFNSLKVANLNIATASLTVASVSSGIAKSELSVISKIPVFGYPFSKAHRLASVFEKGSNTGKVAASLYPSLTRLAKNVTGDSEEDIDKLSEDIHIKLQDLYRDVSFLQNESSFVPLLSKVIKSKHSQIEELKNYLKESITISSSLKTLLGSRTPATYMVLFQNNTELRPTGGFIGSFALITMNKGKMIDMKVFDVYDADGQLEGHVEPPKPIKDYLNEANWFLRDSNWDPDFVVSAKRAEWFLDKELDRPVDGVVAIDLETVKSLVKLVGPLHLPDFNQTLDYKNLYERVQHEVESTFFPGSRKKANLLTGLSRALLEKLNTTQEKDYPKIAAIILDSLKARHIQIYTHEVAVNESLSNLNWLGNINIPSDTPEKETLYLGLAEANLGVNKVNYYIERNAKLNLSYEGSSLNATLTVNYLNKASTQLGASGTYKNYVRLLLPKDAALGKVEVTTKLKNETVDPSIEKLDNRLEAGTIVTIPPDSKAKVTYSWKQPLGESVKELDLYWRKQAGTVADPVTITVKPPLALTNRGEVDYNTTLRQDIILKILWKNTY